MGENDSTPDDKIVNLTKDTPLNNIAEATKQQQEQTKQLDEVSRMIDNTPGSKPVQNSGGSDNEGGGKDEIDKKLLEVRDADLGNE